MTHPPLSSAELKVLSHCAKLSWFDMVQHDAVGVEQWEGARALQTLVSNGLLEGVPQYSNGNNHGIVALQAVRVTLKGEQALAKHEPVGAHWAMSNSSQPLSSLEFTLLRKLNEMLPAPVADVNDRGTAKCAALLSLFDRRLISGIPSGLNGDTPGIWRIQNPRLTPKGERALKAATAELGADR